MSAFLAFWGNAEKLRPVLPVTGQRIGLQVHRGGGDTLSITISEVVIGSPGGLAGAGEGHALWTSGRTRFKFKSCWL